MRSSWKTSGHVQRRSGRRHRYLTLAVLLVCIQSGCLIPPIVFPPTRVHGVLLEEDGTPMEGATVEARSYPPRLIMGAAAMTLEQLTTKRGGKWSYSARKVGDLYIEAIPPRGYKRFSLPGDESVRSIIGPFHDGDCPTNCFVLQLRKIPDGSGGKR